MKSTVLIGVPDLALGSRINSVARAKGIAAVPAFTPHDLLSKAHGESPWLLILDLSASQLSPLESIKHLKADPHTRSLSVLSFMPHSDASLRSAAEAAGSDLVMTKEHFLEALDDILSKKVLTGSNSKDS